MSEMTDLEMTRVCAELMKQRVLTSARCKSGIYLITEAGTYAPITDRAQAMELAERFPLTAADVFSAVAIARHDGSDDPRETDPKRLLVETIAKKAKSGRALV